MIPADLSAERERRRSKAMRLLAVDVRQAALNATPAEMIGLRALVDDCQARTLEPGDARSHVLNLRRQQLGRRAA